MARFISLSHRLVLAGLVLSSVGCPGPEEELEPVFPVDYTTTYTEVRDCRQSPEHDLSFIRVWASPDALGPYELRDAPFPDGAVILKEEFSDPDCEDLIGFAVMRREAGFRPAAGDWRWQRVAFDRAVVDDGALPGCLNCHESCGQPPEGHDWACAEP